MDRATPLALRLQQWVAGHGIVGASLAHIEQGRVTLAVAGRKDVATGEPVDAATVFDAASLTKPLVAHAVLQLVDAGVLRLDECPAAFIKPVVRDDPLAMTITVRHLLTHTSGLQNLRGEEPLRLFFAPGSRFSYSSVGFIYLQQAVEARTGEPLEATVRRLVFEPLGMGRSSLQWRDDFAHNEAVPHEAGERFPPHRAPAASASYSLKTTASDYAAFVLAVLAGARLRTATWQDWLAPAVMVPRGEIVQLEPRAAATEPGIGWGLGWGLETAAGTFFQWGKMNGARAFVMGDAARGEGVVLLANDNRGLRLLREVTAGILPGEHPALDWLDRGVSE